MGYLLLVRHGESRWNNLNKFTGWADVPLSENGLREALEIAKHTKHLRLDAAFTSHLERAHETLLVILSKQHCTGIFIHEGVHGGFGYPAIRGPKEIPIYTSWLLNERNYGLLQGVEKSIAAKRYGFEKVLAWRRSFEARPPKGESLSDVYDRVVPYFKKKIWPELKKNKNILVVAHGNTLRAIIKHLENIPNESIASLELEPGQPFIYQLKAGKLKRTFKSYAFTRPLAWKK